jgi:putative oxygen-independent coproporphyrinogen III oxidase
VAACAAELSRAREAEGLPRATSVFVGGGTPSRLPAEAIAELLGAMEVAEGAEVTVECNPEDAAPERLRRWREAGVGRVSLGVQSTVGHVLAGLGRRHEPETVAPAVAAAVGAGLEVNLDLIIGGPGERDEDWEESLQTVVGLGPGHVSAYCLTVEPGTPLARDASRHPDDDVQARRYERAEQVLRGAGYGWYEVSNWARPGRACRHNQLYWAQGDYRGIGAAAHSHRGGRRWWNRRTPERYIAAIESGEDPTAGVEALTAEQQAFEALALALRTSAGVPAAALPEAPELEGLVERRGERKVLTVAGRLLANEVTSRLVPGDPREPGRRPACR